MHTVTLEEAKQHLAELVDEALHGVEILILKEDLPAVKLVAYLRISEPGQNKYPLRGSVLRYDRPTDPVAEEDWEAMG